MKKKVLRDKEKEKILAKDRASIRIKEEESGDSTSGIDGTDSDTLSNINVKIVMGKEPNPCSLFVCSLNCDCFGLQW